MLVRVVLVPAIGSMSSLDYRVPDDLAEPLPGTRVLVPVGGRRSMAVVVERITESAHEDKLKDVHAVLDDEPVLDASLLRLVRWMADYYLAPIGAAVETALPGALRIETERCVVRTAGSPAHTSHTPEESALLDALGGPPVPLAALVRRFGKSTEKIVARLRRHGLVHVVERLKRETVPTRTVRFYEAVADGNDTAQKLLVRRPALRRIHDYLCTRPGSRAAVSDLRAAVAATAEKLRELTAAGLVRFEDCEEYRTVSGTSSASESAIRLNTAQSVVVDTARNALGRFVPFLLRGVTGSGKTEVYLRLIAPVLEAGGTALVLVPEISLTHQLVERVRARFGTAVAVLHSQLGDGERWDEWRRIARGEASIVIGARSAVFAPLRRLGLIIVDEEHDGSYKQADGVRYQGRDVAVMRAKMSACPVILGSATPSMESHFNAISGRYQLLELPERVESRPLPEVETIDLRDTNRPKTDRTLSQPHNRESPVPMSAELAAALTANLVAGRQSLLFLNRRGFSNFMQCFACGDSIGCPNCSVALTWHRLGRSLRCHYCDHTIAPPARCPGCGEDRLTTYGVGTEQLEAVVRDLLPGARIVRLDRDTTRRKGSQEAMLKGWAAGRYDVMIGTQMVTKGHDVPGVTLVGVVLADQSLNFPDFRAAELTFQLLAQVAGRAGRGADPGRVIVQTLQPHHYSLRAAAVHDFEAFAREELDARAELDYPPHARLLLMRFEGEDLAAVQNTAGEAAELLRKDASRRIAVLGPVAAPLERLRQRYRWQVLLRSRDGGALRAAAGNVLRTLAPKSRKHGVRLVADVDPYNML